MYLKHKYDLLFKIFNCIFFAKNILILKNIFLWFFYKVQINLFELKRSPIDLSRGWYGTMSAKTTSKPFADSFKSWVSRNIWISD